jgi:hypothetical protein
MYLHTPLGAGSGGSSVRVSPLDPTEASVPTGRPADTARIRPSSSDVKVFSRASHPSAPALSPSGPTPSARRSKPIAPAPPAPPARSRTFTVALLFAVGGVSFLIASVVIYLVALLLVK